MPTHIHPILHSLPVSSFERQVQFSSSAPGCTYLTRNHRVPRAPLPDVSVTHIQEDFNRLLRRHYSSFIAHTDSCVRPKPSQRLGFPLYVGSLQVVASPCWKSAPFPTLSPQSLYRCLDPYPVASLRCSYPFLPEGPRPHLREQKFGTPNYRRNATSTTELISGLQSFLYVQAPILARPSGCTHH